MVTISKKGKSMKSKRLLLSGISTLLVFFIVIIVVFPNSIFSQTKEKEAGSKSIALEDKEVSIPYSNETLQLTNNEIENNQIILDSEHDSTNSDTSDKISSSDTSFTSDNVDVKEDVHTGDDGTTLEKNNIDTSSSTNVTKDESNSSNHITNKIGDEKTKEKTSIYDDATFGRIGNIDAEEATIAVSVADPYVNVRELPNTESKVLGKLYNGSVAAVLEKKDDWALIKSGTVKGYIKLEFLNLKLTKDEITKKYGILRAKVDTDGLNVRAKKDIDSKKLTVIYSDEIYSAIKVTNGWVKIHVDDDNVTGYVKKEFVDLIVNYNQAISLEEEKALQRLKDTESSKDSSIQTLSVTKNSGMKYSNADLKLLACLVHAESGNQPYEGKLAVANVVLNRIKSSSYPDSIKTVIYQSGQFSVVKSGSLAKQLDSYDNYDSLSEKLSIDAARSALEGNNNIGNCLYFSRFSDRLKKSHPNGTKIEDHLFW
ncbi:MAG: hypothetical protein K0S41_4091 [Anaerocolumna sp.]|jgi:hypothetical protein|nr:hypothetical protein [Anaerocolumna sp.]